MMIFVPLCVCDAEPPEKNKKSKKWNESDFQVLWSVCILQKFVCHTDGSDTGLFEEEEKNEVCIHSTVRVASC